MPTIIALDVSLSMTRAVPVITNGTSDENITYIQLAIQGIKEFLNYLAKNSKLEHVSLVSVYSLRLIWSVLYPYLKLKHSCEEHRIFLQFSAYSEGKQSKISDFHHIFDTLILIPINISLVNITKFKMNLEMSTCCVVNWAVFFEIWNSDKICLFMKKFHQINDLIKFLDKLNVFFLFKKQNALSNIL